VTQAPPPMGGRLPPATPPPLPRPWGLRVAGFIGAVAMFALGVGIAVAIVAILRKIIVWGFS
jgi:hypothetical protein